MTPFTSRTTTGMRVVLLGVATVLAAGCGRAGSDRRFQADPTVETAAPGACRAQLSYWNGAFGSLTVISDEADIDPHAPGIQLELGVEVFGDASGVEGVELVVNGEAYPTARAGGLWIGTITVAPPAELALIVPRIDGGCDADGALSAVRW